LPNVKSEKEVKAPEVILPVPLAVAVPPIFDQVVPLTILFLRTVNFV
jgi:hypothetical protein